MDHPATVRIDANIQWRWRVAIGGNYVAVCDPLKITLQAKNWSELVEDMTIALDALVCDLIESNEWDAFMREHGWKVTGTIPAPPVRGVRFDVPFSILPFKTDQHDSQRSVHQ